MLIFLKARGGSPLEVWHSQTHGILELELVGGGSRCFFPTCMQSGQIGSSKLTVAGMFIPREWANSRRQALLPPRAGCSSERLYFRDNLSGVGRSEGTCPRSQDSWRTELAPQPGPPIPSGSQVSPRALLKSARLKFCHCRREVCSFHLAAGKTSLLRSKGKWAAIP